jgi:hypothetical protein
MASADHMWQCCNPVWTEHNQKEGDQRERREKRETRREEERGGEDDTIELGWAMEQGMGLQHIWAGKVLI